MHDGRPVPVVRGCENYPKATGKVRHNTGMCIGSSGTNVNVEGNPVRHQGGRKGVASPPSPATDCREPDISYLSEPRFKDIRLLLNSRYDMISCSLLQVLCGRK